MGLRLNHLIASALAGAVLLLASSAVAQVPGGVSIKPPFVTGDCVKSAGAGAISTTGAPCGGGGAGVSSFSAGTTGFTPSSPTTGAVVLSGTLGVPNGGTGQVSFTAHGIVLGNGAGALGLAGPCTTGQVLLGVTGSDPVCGALASNAVTSLAFGTTGLTPSAATQGAITVAGTLGFANGGTSNTTYGDGQLLIGNTATGGLSKATLTQGANVTITNGNGTITIAASGGGGSGCTTSGSAGYLLTDDGAGGCSSHADATFATGTLSLGTAGSEVGLVALKNATSGTLTLSPPTGALNTVTVTVPAATDTLVNLAGTQTLTNKALNTFSGALTFNPANANFTLSPSGTGTGAIAPATAGTINNMVIGGSTPLAGTFTTLTANTSLTLNGSTALTSASGTGATLVTSTGTQTNGRCVTIDASGNHVAAAAACGTGSGTVTSVDVSGGTTGLTTSGGPVTSSGTITLAGTLAVANGGTGQTSYTNGQLLIGNTSGNTLSKATLTQGTGITITNGGGSITIAASGAASAPVYKNTNFTAAAGGSYCVDTSGGAITVTMPASAANADSIAFTDCAKSWALNNMTLSRNGLTIMLLAENLTVATTNANFRTEYTSDGGVTSWFLK